MSRFRLSVSLASFIGALAVAACAGTDPASGGAGSGGSGPRGVGGDSDGHLASNAASGSDRGATTSASAASSGGGGSTSTGASSSAGGGGGANGPCKTTCGATECGAMMPDLCGGTIDCGDCGDSTDYCIKLDPPVFRDAVHAGIDTVQAEHPEFFDFTDSAGGDSYRVLDLLGFRGALVSTLVGEGYDTIADPNSDEELRIRGAADEAENYDLYTSSGYSAYTYTSTCTPANF
jgi:hypothetical protein